MRAIAGGHLPAGGRVLFNGKDLTRMPAHKRARLGIALVPEGRRLFTQMTVEENLLLARSAGRKGPWTLDTVLEAFPMLKARRKTRAGNLSGGQQQAAAIARALMLNPEILLLDEVSLGLSPIAVEGVYASLQTLIALGATLVLVEQDLRRALRVANRVVCMLEGRIVLEGEARAMTREAVTDAYFGLHKLKGNGIAA